jgi:hypothetical protein
VVVSYYIGLHGTREPHPLTPPNGFASAAHAVLWALAQHIPPIWWTYSDDERDAQPARLEGTQ